MSTTNPDAATPFDPPSSGRRGHPAFLLCLVLGLLYTAISLAVDILLQEQSQLTWFPFLLLAIAMLIALGFEFVNGFHDTANAVATVIYTHSLPPHFAVIWSGIWNFIGVLLSSGTVAFGIISLLPIELMLEVGSHSGFAMIFALLLSAIAWNLLTWALGLPASSSHTMIGSIMGVGVANSLLRGRDGFSGVDWDQALHIGYALLISPILGFILASLLLLCLKWLVKTPALYQEPRGRTPPPWWIRSLLILTCTGVSFVHGSNDGQKGMGLIMLILVGTVPMVYALNRAMSAQEVIQFESVGERLEEVLHSAPMPGQTDPAKVLIDYVTTKQFTPQVLTALGQLAQRLGADVKNNSLLSSIPMAQVPNVRHDMYLASETIRIIRKDKSLNLNPELQARLLAYEGLLDKATKFIPVWVKVSVAIALGLGTMVGWRRIVITVGQKIGKSHMNYAQGATAQAVAMLTIGGASLFGLPVSTTQVLSSGVAGTMTVCGSGIQWGTIRNLMMAWFLTLPAAMALSASLYWLMVRCTV